MVEQIKSAEQFKEVISSANLVVVDFFATWCGPCKMIAPVIEKFSKEFTSAQFFKVDVDELSSIAAEYEVSSMPTFLFFKEGKVIGKVLGANPSAVKNAIQQAL